MDDWREDEDVDWDAVVEEQWEGKTEIPQNYGGWETVHLVIPVANEFVKMLEVTDGELADCYRSMGPLVEPGQKIKKQTRTFEMMRVKDHAVVDAMMAELDPRLRDMAKALFMPDKSDDMFDPYDVANQFRDTFLNIFEAEHVISSNNSVDMVYDDGNLFVNGSLVLRSPIVLDHIEFVGSFYPKNLWTLYVQLREQHPDVCKKGGRDYRTLLNVFRLARRTCKSLNKFTKVNQLKEIDYDNPFFWFDVDEEPDLDPHDVVLIGNMPQQVRMRYPQAKYDPGCEGVYDDKVILANLVVGDAMGCKNVDNSLLLKLRVNSRNCLIHAHTIPIDFTPPRRVLRKPRPHNLTAVVDMDIADVTVGRKFYSRFIKSNEERNGRYLGYGDVDLLEQHSSVDYVVGRASKILVCDAVKVKNRHTRSVRMREEQLYNMSRDGDWKPDPGRFIKLSGKPVRGCLLRDIPDMGDAGLIMNSLYVRAIDHGFGVIFTHGVWTVI